MKTILKQIRSRLFKHYELRISSLEAHVARLESNLVQASQSLQEQLNKMEVEKNKLAGQINHIEKFYGETNNELSHSFKELELELKQLKQRPYSDWLHTKEINNASVDNSLYVERFTESLRKA